MWCLFTMTIQHPLVWFRRDSPNHQKVVMFCRAFIPAFTFRLVGGILSWISWWWVVRILFLCDQNLILMRGSPCFMRGVFPTSCYSQSTVGNSIGKLLSHCCRSGEWWKSFESEMVKVIFGSLLWSFVYTIFYTDTSVVDFFLKCCHFFVWQAKVDAQKARDEAEEFRKEAEALKKKAGKAW